MILNYLSIGDLAIKERSITETNSIEYKRYILNHFCSELNEYQKTDQQGNVGIGRLLTLNLDTRKQEAEFSLANQLTPSAAADVMLFKKPAPNDPSIFGVTNSLFSIVTFELWHTLNNETYRQINWTRPQKSSEFKTFLDKIRDIFFNPIKTGYLINKEKVIDSQKERFPQPINDDSYKGVDKDKDFNKILAKQLDDYHKKTLQSLYSDNQGFAISVDGILLHKGEFGVEYIDFLYYRIIEANYLKKINGNCHICSSQGMIGESVSLRHKFYGTTNPLFFDNVSNTKTYTSFGICKECDIKLVVGMTYAMNRLKFNILDLSCLVLPVLNYKSGLIDESDLRAIERVLNYKQGRRESIQSDIQALFKLSQKCKTYSMVFFHKEPKKQEFKIIGLITNLAYADVAKKTEDLENICEDSKLYMIGQYSALTLKGLRMQIIPSARSHKIKTDGEYASTARSISKLVSDYLKNRSFIYQRLITDFVEIWSHIEYNNKVTFVDHEIAAFIFTLYLKHLYNFNQLKGVKTMEQEQKTITQLDSKKHVKYIEYFENHGYLFMEAENGCIFRGLFLLGVFIGMIENAEYKKTKKKTFSNRINFKGISPRRILGLYDTVEEYLKIRDVWVDNQLMAHCNECLLGIDSSNLMPQEVVFYILAGKAFENYLGIIYSKEHEETENKKEVTND